MMNKLICFVKRRIHSPSFLKILVPILIVVMTVVFGWASGIGKEPLKAAWNSIGHLIGETSFDDVKLDDIVGIPIFNILSRITGLLLLPYAFFLIVHEQYRALLTSLRIRMWKLREKPFVVVCGLGWKGFELVKNILGDQQSDLRVVGVDLMDTGDQIEELRSLGMAFFKGDATSETVLKRTRAEDSDMLFVMTGDDELNCRIAMKIAELFPDSTQGENDSVNCYVSVDDQRQRDFLEDFAAKKTNKLYIHCFNLFEQAARAIIRDKGLFSNPNQNVHSIVVGNTPMARAVLLQTLRMMHLHQKQVCLITVICEKEEKYRDQLQAEFPCLKTEDLSPELEKATQGIFPTIDFVEMPLSPSGWLELENLYCHLKKSWRTNLYICVDDGIKSLALMKLIDEKLSLAKADVNRNCYYNYPETELDRKDTDWTEFGDYKQTCSVDCLKNAAESELAKDVFEVWGGKRDKWLQEASWSKESNRQSADHIYIKLSLCGLSTLSSSEEIITAMGKVKLDENWKPDIQKDGSRLGEMAQVEHRRWCAERLLAGWLPLSAEEQERWNKGIGKGAMKKCLKSGCLVPFEELGGDDENEKLSEQKKDYAIVGGIEGWTKHIKLLKKDYVELAAEQVHIRWMEARKSKDWTLGAERDDKAKTHPSLVPYRELPEGEKMYDRELVRVTVLTVEDAGFRITRSEKAATVSVSKDLLEKIATKVHARWMTLRLADGWEHGTYRKDKAKTHPNLVAYKQLPDSEKEFDRTTARMTIQALDELGCTLVSKQERMKFTAVK